MSGHQDDDQRRSADNDGADNDGGGTVSEGGSGSLNAQSGLGGADNVPDTPDVNDTGEGDAADTRESGQGADPS